jgi:hypothetical protein
MLIPKYWAEGRLRHRDSERQVTVRRFGWSDESQADAQSVADERTKDALDCVLRGSALKRRETKVPYNGAEGVPIREEIIDRQGDVVVTRNSYGARCLNTPDVLFADVDWPECPSCLAGCLTSLLTFVIVFYGLGWVFLQIASGFYAVVLLWVAVFIALPISMWTSFRLPQLLVDLRGGYEAQLPRCLTKFLRANPDWSVRVYRTPKGWRLLVTHRTFAPDDPAVQTFFSAVRADPVYVRMCVRQQCFRARVSPKPWRIGIPKHIMPRPGVWPIDPSRLPEREAWVAAYESLATSFASCRFVELMGRSDVHPDVQPTLTLHDDMSRAISGLPIA